MRPRLPLLIDLAATVTLIPRPFDPAIGVPLLREGPWRRRFRDGGTNIHTFQAPDGPADDGLFAIGGNPMYLGFRLVLPGFAISRADRAWGPASP
jgi:hypothetical protein